MRREFHVRFCEGLGVRLPRATRPVIALSSEDDARKVMGVLPKRFGKYGLKLHPDKTRLVRFLRPRWPDTSKSFESGSFDLLGFTHFWGRSRKGSWVVKRKTAGKSFGRALRRVNLWCRKHLHHKVAWQHAYLVRMLRGHYSYFGVTGNGHALAAFLYEVRRVWRKWLHRRTGRGAMPWPRFIRLLERHPLPRPEVVHSIYQDRRQLRLLRR